MTVKEFMDLMNNMIRSCPEITNAQLVMVGYNEEGERIYKIPVMDYTWAGDENIVRLWDN